MKEKGPEFIVSTEELKKNQERSYAREYYRKQAIQDKIVTAIILILAVAMIVILAMSLNKYTEKNINHCIENGNSEYFCNTHLRG